MIKYHNAKDADGNIVNIADAERGKLYWCIGCGKEMIAKKGEEREKHFAHKREEDCMNETYLHAYAKQYIKSIFDDREKPFLINYQRKAECCNKDTCDYRSVKKDLSCFKGSANQIDLKKHYDTCLPEQKCGNCKPDLMLSSSQNTKLPPIWIEIAVTHKCEQEKLDTGVRIIEISLPPNTDDLSELRQLNESKKENGIEISFYNFPPHKKNSLNLYKEQVRIFSSEKQLYCKEMTCAEFGKPTSTSENQFEVQFIDGNGGENRVGIALANQTGLNIQNCYICQYYEPSKNYFDEKCIKGKNICGLSSVDNCKDFCKSSEIIKFHIDNYPGKYVIVQKNTQ